MDYQRIDQETARVRQFEQELKRELREVQRRTGHWVAVTKATEGLTILLAHFYAELEGYLRLQEKE